MTTDTQATPLRYPGRSVYEAQKNMESRGSYWWTPNDIENVVGPMTLLRHQPDTMRAFGTRVGSEFYGPGGLYFITSEKHPCGRWPETVRLYSVRKYNLEKNDIETVGRFGEFKTAGPARTLARRLAKGE